MAQQGGQGGGVSWFPGMQYIRLDYPDADQVRHWINIFHDKGDYFEKAYSGTGDGLLRKCASMKALTRCVALRNYCDVDNSDGVDIADLRFLFCDHF